MFFVISYEERYIKKYTITLRKDEHYPLNGVTTKGKHQKKK